MFKKLNLFQHGPFTSMIPSLETLLRLQEPQLNNTIHEILKRSCVKQHLQYKLVCRSPSPILAKATYKHQALHLTLAQNFPYRLLSHTSNMSSSAHPQTRPVWLIIGATSGIGQEIARKVQPFATVIAVGRNQSALKGLAKIGCKTVQLDLTSSDAIVRRAIDDIIRQEGFIDFVVNVAGYLLEGGVEEHGYVSPDVVLNFPSLLPFRSP